MVDTQESHILAPVIQARLSSAKFITRLGLVDGSVNSPLITLETKQIKTVVSRRPWVGLIGYIYGHLIEMS